MYDSFLDFINEHKLVQTSQRVLLAVSGGVDSVVMADLFARSPYAFGIAHVNFGLRGDESDADATLVQELAAACQVPFHTTRFETAQYATREGLSIQEAARQLRYDWFDSLARQHGYDRIATAHHQNDVLETLLLNLVRGTGLAGLRSIPVQNGPVIRPLWFASRADLSTYAHERQLRWREDASNSSDKYARNKLRHQVVPVLESLNPDLIHTLTHTMERLRAAEVIVNDVVRTECERLVNRQGAFLTLAVESLLGLAQWPFLLSEWLKPFGFSYAQSRAIRQVVGKPAAGQVFRSATHALWYDRNQLIVAPLSVERPFCLDIPIGKDARVGLPDGRQLQFRWINRPGDLHIPPDASQAYLDADQLGATLTLRRWEEGDRFQPLHMRGHKLVSNLLNDRKVSQAERSRTAVLTSDAGIIWVVGHRLAHLARITEKTDRVLIVQLGEA